MYRVVLIVIALTLTVIIPSANGQGRDTTGTVLPDISPREVEIRGQLEISFPSLRRQPLIGFNPPPRVPDIPASRRPFIELYKLASADLPHTPLGQPDPPEVNSLADMDRINGELEASAGRYFDRIIRARLGGSISRQSSLYARFDYEGSDGFELREEAPELQNPYDGFEGLIGFQQLSPRVGWGLELDGGVESYTLYGTNILNNDSLSQQIVLPDRKGYTGGAAFWLRSQADANIDTDFRLRFSGTQFQTDLFDSNLMELPRLDRREKRATSHFDLGVPFSIGAFLLSTEVSGAGLDDDSIFDFTTYYLNLGSGFRIDIGSQMNLIVGGRYLATSLMDPTSTDDLTSYLSADAQLNLFPTSGLTIYVRNQPGVTPNTLWDIFRNNPFVIDRPDMQSTLRPIDATAGFNLFIGNTQIAAHVGYMQSPNYMFFENETGLPGETGYNYRRGIFAIDYRDAEILSIAGDISFVLLRGLHAKFGVEYRDAELRDTKEHIPYFSPLVSENMISYNFNNERTLLQLLASYYGSRYRNRLEDVKVDDYIDLDLLFFYKVHRNLGVIARIDNIVGSRLEHWQHYPEAPFTFSLGLSVMW